MIPQPTPIVITDLTRMHRGMVCIAGYDKDLRCIRPVLPPPGIPEHSLFGSDGKPIIFPFAVIQLDLLEACPGPPHTEDFYFFSPSPRFIRPAKDPKNLLERTLSPDVCGIFEQPIHTDFGFYVMDGQGPRSLGTIRPDAITKVGYEPDPNGGTWDYRLTFTDARMDTYRLKITDLTWQYFCHNQRSEQRPPAQIALELTHTLQTRDVYLRIGLARGWKEHPERCFLQITGIYTFPDYLNGKTFADLKSK
ncbi:MAG TPA: hypothetical protein VI451_12685 [Anaerolineales bacterium]|nr:hypothetical protein [Anaerolineales bacterium]